MRAMVGPDHTPTDQHNRPHLEKNIIRQSIQAHTSGAAGGGRSLDGVFWLCYFGFHYLQSHQTAGMIVDFFSFCVSNMPRDYFYRLFSTLARITLHLDMVQTLFERWTWCKRLFSFTKSLGLSAVPFSGRVTQIMWNLYYCRLRKPHRVILFLLMYQAIRLVELADHGPTTGFQKEKKKENIPWTSQ